MHKIPRTILWRPNRNREFTRREILFIGGKATAVTLVVGSFSSLIAACGDDDDDDAAEATATPEPEDDAVAEPTTAADEQEATPTAEPADGEAQAGGTLNYGTRGDVDFGSLDMTTTTGTDDLEIGRSLNEPYVWLLSDGSFAPGLAESWEISEDALQYTFKLREDVVFHDGTPMNAEAAKFNFDRMTNRETNPSGLSYSYLGAGGAGFDSTDVVDDYTFRINLTQPNAIFMFRMRRKYMAPQSPTAVEEFGDEYFRNPVGCGPFKFVEWEEGDHVTYERFEDYTWGTPQLFDNSGPPYLDRQTQRIFDDASTKATALEAGELDYAMRLNPEDMLRFEDMTDIEIRIREKNGQSSNLGCNVQRAPTDDLAVRRAMGFAIDREALVDTVFFGLHDPAYHLFTPTMWSYDPSLEELFGYDPDMAEQILEDAGWVRNGGDIREKDGEPLRLLYILSQEGLPVGQFVQAELREIGMDVELQTMAGAGLTEAVLAGEHNITGGVDHWIQEDPDVVRNWLHSSLIDVRQNPIRAEDPELDDLLDRGIAYAGGPHEPEREAFYQDIQRIVMERAYIIPLHFPKTLEAYRPYVHAENIGFDPYGTYHEWLDVWMEE